jgi:hypothetical protein
MGAVYQKRTGMKPIYDIHKKRDAWELAVTALVFLVMLPAMVAVADWLSR